MTRVVPPADIFEAEAPRPASNVLSFADFAKRSQERRQKTLERPFFANKKTVAEARAEMGIMSDQGDWSAALGQHLVALYCWCHEHVYGVEPSLPVRSWSEGARLANELTAKHFGGDFEKTIDFMRWAWKREADREKWRREHQKDGSRIGLRLQFGEHLVPDYKIHRARVAR